MTFSADLARLPRSSFVEELARRSPALTATGLALLLALAPLALAHLLDARAHGAESIWAKPMRFALALGLYALTLAFFTGWLSEAARASRLLRASVALGVAAIAFEQGWISVQAARGTSSHFNTGTPFETAMWAFMGIGAVVLTAMAPVMGWLLWRSPRPGLAPALSVAAATGLLLTLPLTLLTAGTLAALGGPTVGIRPPGDTGLFVMGWSRGVGDLRVAHFFATHTLHAVPIAAAALIPLFGRERLAPVLAVAAAYTLFVLAVFAQALAGRPFL